MLHLEGIYQTMAEFVPLLVTIAVVVLALWFADWLLVRRASLTIKSRVPGQVAMMLLTAVALISIIFPCSGNEEFPPPGLLFLPKPWRYRPPLLMGG